MGLSSCLGVKALRIACDKVKTEQELGWETGGQPHLDAVSLRLLLAIQLQTVTGQLRLSQGEGLVGAG